MNDSENKIWQLERQVFQLQTLFEIARSLNQCRDVDSVFSNVLATMAGTFGARAAVGLSKGESGWRCSAVHGNASAGEKIAEDLAEKNFDKLHASDQQAMLEQTISGRRQSDPEFTMWQPVQLREGIVGGFFFGRKIRSEPYSREDQELLRAATTSAAHVLDNILLYSEVQASREQLSKENKNLRQQIRYTISPKTIIGSSPGIEKVRQDIENFARSNAAVLIIGETGTGKELVASAIHAASARAEGPFVAINCTAIPETLVESEFFGIESGAATGVTSRAGYFEQADGGTIFIDEIGDMPLSSQAKVLRTLQDHKVRRVGGNQETSVDVRVVAATNRDLKADIKSGRFREDLFYRLGVLEIRLPALRQRRTDIAILAHHFLELKLQRQQRSLRGFSPETLRIFEHYSWPGNVRELENEVERLVTLADDGALIQPEHLSPHLLESDEDFEINPDTLMSGSMREAVDDLETKMIRYALKVANGNKSEVARRLGLSRLGLQRKMERLQIKDGKN